MRHGVCIAVSLALTVLAIWLLPFCREQRRLFFKDFGYSAQASQQFKRHPEILYAQAVQVETIMDYARAADLYARTAARNPLYMDAWLRLAELAAAAGNLDSARDIALFCDVYIAPVLRWKWPHTLLAQGLGLDDIFSRNINFLIARQSKVNDAINLLDTHSQGNPREALSLLVPENRPAYLQWAIRWKNTPASQTAWDALTQDGYADKEVLSDYVQFLVSQKLVAEAAVVWQHATGIVGMTNGGFEDPISNKGFDWRAPNSSEGHWDLRRETGGGRDGSAALHIRFNGQSNLAFYHIRQVVPVVPGTAYRLSFWWRDKALSTDQVPFVEVMGYDAKGLSVRSQDLRGQSQWQQAYVDFTSPADCTAVIVRLRRLQSHRFDNKIRGNLWLDEFELKILGNG